MSATAQQSLKPSPDQAVPAQETSAEPADESTSTTTPKDPPTPTPPPATGANETNPTLQHASGTTDTASTASDQDLSQYGLSRQALEQEVSQVMGSFGSWWGGVKKQSASALANLKADLDKTVTQAQADIEYLRTAKVEVVRKDPEQFAAEQAADKEKSKSSQTDATAAQSILDRLSTSSSHLQQTFQATLASAANNPSISNVNQLRTQLAENLRVSSAKENLDMSVRQAEKLAEEYLKKGDAWRKEAGKWLADAVKVVPPDGSADVTGSVPSWDGSDWYSFSTSPTAADTSATPQSVPQQSRQSLSALNVAGSRKEALLARLREDQALLLIDPSSSNESEERRQAFAEWRERSGSMIDTAKQAEEDAVGVIRMALVPEHLDDDQFWSRYLFHKHQIEQEDERRRRILEDSQTQTQDEFSWDDEPDTADAREQLPEPSPVRAVAKPTAEVKAEASSSTSPRDSEESYDLVSEQSTSRGKRTAPPSRSAPADDDDSDWE